MARPDISLFIGAACSVFVCSPVQAQSGDCHMCGDDPDVVAATGTTCTLYTEMGWTWCAQDWIEEEGGQYYCYTSFERCGGGHEENLEAQLDFLLREGQDMVRGALGLADSESDWNSDVVFHLDSVGFCRRVPLAGTP